MADRKGAKKSVRVQLFEEDRQRLVEIAYEQGCIYNEEGSLSLLLTQLALGKLDIVEIQTASTSERERPNLSVIGLELRILCDLNGAIATITNKIAEVDGNIYAIHSRETDPVIRIYLEMSKHRHWSELIAALEKIVVKNVLTYKQFPVRLEELLRVLDGDEKYAYDVIREKKSRRWAEEHLNLDTMLKSYGSRKFLTDIVLTLGLRLELENFPGTLANLTNRIAQKGISILEIDQGFYDGKERNVVSLLLGFYPLVQGESIAEAMPIESVETFISKLRHLKGVRSVHQLNVGYFD